MYSSPTLSRYIGRQFIVYFLIVLAILLGLVFLIDLVELLRRATNKPNATPALMVQMALYKLPDTGQTIIPFVVLFSGMFVFWRLTRSHELVVARAAGLSAWQFILPVLMVAAVIGVVRVTLINPLATIYAAQYSYMESRYLSVRGASLQNNLRIGKNGLWVRQALDDRQYFLHAEGAMRRKAFELRTVSVFLFDADNAYTGRLDAATATLLPDAWELKDVVEHRPQGQPVTMAGYTLPTELDLATITSSFAPPDTVSFWKLPQLIEDLELTGFPATRHRLQYSTLLTQPPLYCVMVLFASVFSMRLPRRGGTMLMVAGGALTGFALFMATNIARTLGLSETIPVAMATWMPVGIGLLLGVALLLHLEDG